MKHPESLKPIPGWARDEISKLDAKLAIRWNPKMDRWQIMRRRERTEPTNVMCLKEIFQRDWWQYVAVMTWENQDGTYRDLDMRLIHALRKGDMHARGFRAVLGEIEAEEEAFAREKQRQFKDLETHMLEEMYDKVVVERVTSRPTAFSGR